jgi:hypothetical protein
MTSKLTSSGRVLENNEEGGVMLTCGPNNVIRWRDVNMVNFGIIFGFLVNVFTTLVPYVVPRVTPAMFMPLVTNGGPHGLSEQGVEALRVDAEKARNRDVRDLAKLAPNFFSAMMKLISVESRNLMAGEMEEEYKKCQLERDPNSLWQIIWRTHFTHVAGGGIESMKDLDVVEKRTAFALYVQTAAMAIAIFLEGFKAHLAILKSMGNAVMTEKQQAITFLQKLEPFRYGRMRNDLKNIAINGGTFPQTLQAAYRTASTWMTGVIARTPAPARRPRCSFCATVWCPNRLSRNSVSNSKRLCRPPRPPSRRPPRASSSSLQLAPQLAR